MHVLAMWVFILSLVLVVSTVVSVFAEIPYLSLYPFWVAVLTHVVVALGKAFNSCEARVSHVSTRA